LRIYLFILTVFVSITCFSQEDNINEIRICFNNIEGTCQIKKLVNMTENDLENPVVLAYNYTGKLMMIDYSNNPFEKYKVFKIKTRQIDSIVVANPKNIEIRLLRYVVQKNSPYFLRYKSDLNNDLMYIKSNLFKEKEFLQGYIKNLLHQFNNERSRNPSKFRG